MAGGFFSDDDPGNPQGQFNPNSTEVTNAANNARGWAVGDTDASLSGWSATDNAKYHRTVAAAAANASQASSSNAAISAAAAKSDSEGAAASAATAAGWAAQTAIDAISTDSDVRSVERLITDLDTDTLKTLRDETVSSRNNAANSATGAAGSATAAAGSATAAAGSATTATTQAGTATTQAGIATTQAGIATTQAGNAATSAMASAGSAEAARGYDSDAEVQAFRAGVHRAAAEVSRNLAGRWAVGPSRYERDTDGASDTNNARYWAERAEGAMLDTEVVTYTIAFNDTSRVFSLYGSNGDTDTVTIPGGGGGGDGDTTYTISFSDGTLTLTPSSGAAQSVVIPDSDTTYTLQFDTATDRLTLQGSDGTESAIILPIHHTGPAPDQSQLTITANPASLELGSGDTEMAINVTVASGYTITSIQSTLTDPHNAHVTESQNAAFTATVNGSLQGHYTVSTTAHINRTSDNNNFTDTITHSIPVNAGWYVLRSNTAPANRAAMTNQGVYNPRNGETDLIAPSGTERLYVAMPTRTRGYTMRDGEFRLFIPSDGTTFDTNWTLYSTTEAVAGVRYEITEV